MDSLLQDIRFAIRTLLKRPGFTGITVLTLALGIGTCATMFSLVNEILLRPLPYPEPERLMEIGSSSEDSSFYSFDPQRFQFVVREQRGFSDIAAFQSAGGGFNLSTGGEPTWVTGMQVSEGFFRTLRVAPAIGRGFSAEDDTPGAAPVAVLSQELWRRNFGADPAIIGKTIALNHTPCTVIGVLPEGFRFEPRTDLFIPLQPKSPRHAGFNFSIVGRLSPGVSEAQAQSAMKSLSDTYRQSFPKGMGPSERFGIRGFRESYVEGIRQPLLILFGAVVLVLVIACANVANMLLSRTETRRKEMAVRIAIGAGRGRLIRQLMTEGLVLASLSAVVGATFAVVARRTLSSFIPEGTIQLSDGVSFDVRFFGFVILITLLAGLGFSLATVFRFNHRRFGDALKERDGKNSRGWLRSGMLVGEVGLSFVLLMGAALLIQTFRNLTEVDLGFDPNRVLTVQIPTEEKYQNAVAYAAFSRTLSERIAAIPGVEASSITNQVALSGQFNFPFRLESKPPDQISSGQYRIISGEYFRTMRIPTRQGRVLTDSDSNQSPDVVVINETFARRYFRDRNPIGERIVIGIPDQQPLSDRGPRTIVGIVADTKELGQTQDVQPTMYVPLAQVSDNILKSVAQFLPTFVLVRTTGDPATLIAPVRKAVAQTDPQLAIARTSTLEQNLSQSLAREQFNMRLIGTFALLALILATIGLYGVMAYSVTQRTREIGLRIALGAQVGTVLALILKQGMKLTALGMVIGAVASVALARITGSLLFGVTPTDARTFVVVSVLLGTVTLLACWLPARRAAKTDPITALRHE